MSSSLFILASSDALQSCCKHMSHGVAFIGVTLHDQREDKE